MRTVVEDTQVYTLYHDVGETKFNGCQCFGDCSCMEDFKSQHYDQYAVFKKNGKRRTTHHKTIDEARNRIAQLL